jgi:glycosyltransferase involved in cell wall biosynthesis
MKIAIDVSPLKSGHKIRGVGFYLTYLKKALLKYYPDNEYIFFEERNAIPEDVDLVHYPYFDPFFLTLPLNKKYKTIVTVHDLIPLVFPDHFPAGLKGKFRWQIQKYNLRHVDAIITNSEVSKKDILNLVDVPEKRVAVTHLAADDVFRKIDFTKNQIDQLRKKYNLPNEFILYVGDVTWNKNVPTLLKAIKDIDVSLVMVGKSLVVENVDKTNVWNNDIIETQTLAEENPKVHRLGFLPTEDLVAIYNLATVFVFPSLYEGFGLPVIEAMQSGCPVITTRGGSLEEVAGDAAYYVDGSSVESLSEAIMHVMHSKSLREELIEKGFAQAKFFSWEKTAAQTMAVYESVLQK